MFDVGFLELLVVFVVALIVIGPERMPEAVRSAMSFSRTLKRTLHNARMEVERQIGADDIRRQLHNEEIMRSLNESKAAIQSAVNETGDVLQATDKELRIASAQLTAAKPASEIPATPPAGIRHD